MGQGDLVSIVEVMGRSAGWIAAGAALAKRRDHPHDPPHLIYLPEIPFNQEKFLEDIRRVLKREKYCLIVVAEGLIDADGNYVSADPATDAFGHAQLGGVGEFLKDLVEANLPGVKARLAKPGIMQRCRRPRRLEDRRRRGVPRRPGRGQGRHQRRDRQDGHARARRRRPLHLRNRPRPARATSPTA